MHNPLAKSNVPMAAIIPEDFLDGDLVRYAMQLAPRVPVQVIREIIPEFRDRMWRERRARFIAANVEPTKILQAWLA